MNKELVIATYNSTYDWIQSIGSEVKVTVYNKGHIINSNEIPLLNVGRDVHTFFYHLATNYDKLADYTFFSQDNPFDHVENYVEVINCEDESLLHYHAKKIIGGCWFFNTYSDDSYRKYNLHLPPHEWRNDVGHGSIKDLRCDKRGEIHHGGLQVEEMWNELFLNAMPSYIYFVPAGHFCVRKDQVYKRPKYFYERVVTLLEKHPQSPWIIERLEGYVFDNNYIIK